jgi:hypothetical protein
LSVDCADHIPRTEPIRVASVSDNGADGRHRLKYGPVDRRVANVGRLQSLGFFGCYFI